MKKYRKDAKENNQGRRLGFYAVLILCCAAFFGAGFACLQLRGGVQVKTAQEGDILPAAETVLYRQDDVRWGEDRLGDSKYTLRSSGCLVSCIAAALSMENDVEETPGTLNEIFSERQAYDAEGNLQWEVLSERGEYQAEVYGEVSADIIDACLLQGHYPIVRVRMCGLGNVHYVLIIGVKEGNYLCMDPLRDEITELSAYGNRVYAVRCVYFAEQDSRGKEGDVPPDEEVGEDIENAFFFTGKACRRQT